MMGLSIPRPLVEFILLGPSDDRRQLQDSPILGDVWIEFGKQPTSRLDLLISPYMRKHAGAIAAAIDERLGHGEADDPANIAYLQGLVAARLTFEEVLTVVVPKTKWWIDKWTKKPAKRPIFEHEVMRRYSGKQPAADLIETLTKIIHAAQDWNAKERRPRRASDVVPIDRFAALAGLILWAGNCTDSAEQNQSAKTLIENILDQAKKEVANISIRLSAATDHGKRKPMVQTSFRCRKLNL
jgi:serine protease AprX